MKFTIAFLASLPWLSCLSGCANKSLDHTAYKDLAYVPGGGERQSGDLYLPVDSKPPYPVAVVIHGGGWTGRDRSDMAAVANQLAENGFAAFNINYRLAPDSTYPAQLEDVQSALYYLTRNASSWQLDITRFITVGYSAGAHLALLAAEIKDPIAPSIKAVIAGGSPVDFLLYPESPFITKLIGGTPETFADTWKMASPINHVTEAHPPVFLYHGRWDQLVELKNAKMMQSALKKQGVPVELDVRPFGGHLLTGYFQSSSIKKGIHFVKEQFGEY